MPEDEEKELITPEDVQVTSRTMPPYTGVQMPEVNIGTERNPVMATPTVSSQPVLTPEEKAQQDLIARGESYSGKDLGTLMKENPAMRPTDFMNAINAYNVANGKDKMDEYDAMNFFGDYDPTKNQQQVKKDRRRSLWAEGINGIADVLQNVVNYANGTNVKAHDAEKTRERNAQLRRYMDKQRVQRLNNLIAGIKAENDARRAAAAEQRKFQQQIEMEKLKAQNDRDAKLFEWQNNPKIKADVDEAISRIDLNKAKSDVEVQNAIMKELEAQNYPKKLAADIAKTYSEVALNGARASESRQRTKNAKIDFDSKVLGNYRNMTGNKGKALGDVISGEDAAERARKQLGIE